MLPCALGATLCPFLGIAGFLWRRDKEWSVWGIVVALEVSASWISARALLCSLKAFFTSCIEIRNISHFSSHKRRKGLDPLQKSLLIHKNLLICSLEHLGHWDTRLLQSANVTEHRTWPECIHHTWALATTSSTHFRQRSEITSELMPRIVTLLECAGSKCATTGHRSCS